jgi:hypothetical protein
MADCCGYFWGEAQSLPIDFIMYQHEVFRLFSYRSVEDSAISIKKITISVLKSTN